MARRGQLAQTLRLIAESDAAVAVDFAAAAYRADRDPYLLSLRAFAEFAARQFDDSAATATSALVDSIDDEALMAARALSGLAAAGWPQETPADRDDSLVTAFNELGRLDALDSDAREFILYLLAEAALACARLDLATRFVELSGPLPVGFLADEGVAHPYVTMIQVMRMRVSGFHGRVSEALAIGEIDAPRIHTPLMDLVLESTRCFVLGNAAERARLLEVADRLDSTMPEPVEYIPSGCYLLVSYGFVAVGKMTTAARFLLAAGGSAELDGLTIIDRALGLELLTAFAVAADDLDAAEAWRDLALPLLGHPSARPTVERLLSRVELLAGHPTEAAAWGQLAVEHAREDGRAVESAEGEIVLSRARIALSQSGVANARLDAMVADAIGSGHFAARVAASRELRAVGRRLRPRAGTGWEGLSGREKEVATLVAEGLGNQEIASRLHLSQHTVRAHVSRVLAAFGVASRFAMAARVAELVPTPHIESIAALTPRQDSVVDRIVLGRSNDDIARELGISIKTVEKHVSEILKRWDVDSRIGIVRAAGSRSDRTA